MRNQLVFSALLCVLAAGCSSDKGDNDVPTAVKGAFYSEHPHAEIDRPTTRTSSDGQTRYEIPYTRADGTRGIAVYSSMGEYYGELPTTQKISN